MRDDSVFEQAGFIGEYRSSFESFFRPYFNSETALYSFFQKVFLNDRTDKKPRQMMNHIKWFVSLSTDIEKIRPGRDPLKILFLRICLESLCKITASNPKDFFQSFSFFFSDAGKNYILSHFAFIMVKTPTESGEREIANFETHEGYQLTLSDFMNIIRETRNMVAHDGDYWSMQFFALDECSEWITAITTNHAILSFQPQGKELTYLFETTLQYDSFRFYFVEACINYLNEYIERAHGV